MKFKFFLLLILLHECFNNAEIEKNGNVYQLTDENFDQFIEDHPAVMVKLYAPWCGHCKQLAPEYSQAAEMMEDDDNIIFAEIDASKEISVAEKLEIEGYPTILFFLNGVKTEYDSDRSSYAIVDWIQKKMQPKILGIETMKELDEIYNNTNTSVLIFYLGKPEGEIYGAFNLLSNEIQQNGLFFIESNSQEILDHYKPKNQLIILKKFDEERVDLELNTDAQQVEEFVKWNKVPVIMDLSMNYADVIFTDKVSCLFVFLNENDTEKNNQINKELEIASKVMQKKMYITTAIDNNELTQSMMEFLVLIKDDLPKVFIIEPKDNTILKYAFDKEINSENLIKFFEEFQKGELKPFYQSEEIPESDYIENVRQLVGKNYKEIREQEKEKYLFIKYYAKWCPHCQKLRPKFIRLAEKLKEANNKIILAEIDSTLNEVEDQIIEGVPTLILYKPNGESLEFNERLSERAIVDFLKNGMEEDWVDIQLDPETEEDLEEEEEEEDLEEPTLEDYDDDEEQEIGDKIEEKTDL